jgi:hypothetical protein
MKILFLSFVSRPLGSACLFFFLAASGILLTITGCKKEAPEPTAAPGTTLAIERGGEEPGSGEGGSNDRYYLDNQPISADVYNAQGADVWFHSLTTVVNGANQNEFHAFSTKGGYEQWGVAKGIAVAKMNQFDERTQFLADSLGITAQVLAGQTPSDAVTDFYEQEITETYDALFSSGIAYAGSRFYSNDCVPGSPGCNNAFVYFLPTFLSLGTWINVPIYAWMEDNAEAWNPRLNFSSTGKKITLRAWSYPFFITPWWQSWKKKHTVIFPAGTTSLFVPFGGPISVWKNRISSWTIFPEP